MAGQLAWEKLSTEEVFKKLTTSATDGLSEKEARIRLERDGTNALSRERDFGILGRVLEQFKSPLVFVLLGAGVATLVLGEFVDTLVIFIALAINVVVGTLQEERADRAFEKLSASQEHFAIAIRDGRRHRIPTEELVRGDLVFIESGQYVPADLRLTFEKELFINEAALTGEWEAVPKSLDLIKSDVPLAERRNMAWMGTLVSEGYGRGVVVGTGDKTQVGLIARELQGVEERATPLKRNIQTVARFLTYAIAGIIFFIFVLGVFRGEAFSDMLLISIAIAVAAIPSGLPAAVTVVLALGMESILKMGGLVRNLLAAETLGSTTIILTDKTGTLTEAKMQLAAIYCHESFKKRKKQSPADWTEEDREVLKAAVLASDAFVEEATAKKNGAGTKQIVVHGRPVERAVLLAGLAGGISQEALEKEQGQIDYLQFDSARRFAGSLNKNAKANRNTFYVTGAPETVLENSVLIYKSGTTEKMTLALQEQFHRLQERLSSDGKRLIGVAYKEVSWETIPEKSEKDFERQLIDDSVFLGFLVFEDPVRPDVKEAIAEVKGAGAQVLMLTGDNPQTARAIACEVGISCDHREVKTGRDIEKKNDEELYKMLKTTKVFARVLPSQKLRIARILKNKGEVVAMTGDGVNDAPALRSADIGIAVGSGTEVAKEASDMVLINNSFSIIVAAIREGRKIIANLKKIIAYLLSTSFSEIFVIGAALAAGAPLPLLPAQILWANIIEEGFMSFPFAFEKGDKNLMKHSPRSASAKNIMTGKLRTMIFLVSLITGIFLVAIYFWLLSLDIPIERIRTVMFAALTLDALFFAFSLKSLDQPLWRINPFSNLYLVGGLVASFSILLAALFWAPLQLLLTLVPLSALEILLLVGVGLFNLLTIEIAKYFLFEKKR